MQFGVLPQQRQIRESVRVAGENNLPSIAPLRNMMRNVNGYDARKPTHDANVSEQVGGLTLAIGLEWIFQSEIPNMGGENG